MKRLRFHFFKEAFCLEAPALRRIAVLQAFVHIEYLEMIMTLRVKLHIWRYGWAPPSIEFASARSGPLSGEPISETADASLGGITIEGFLTPYGAPCVRRV